MTTENESAVEHSLDDTKELATAIRDLLKEEDDLDVYDKLIVKGTTVSVRVTNDDDLEYLVTVTPVD